MDLYTKRIVSGMRPTGRLHLGNYHGALHNWVQLQTEYECFFFIADLHALTTHYSDTAELDAYVLPMAQDWLASGLDPDKCVIFLQSEVPEHAELHLLLSMITPLSWLERVPTYKDQQEKLSNRDLATYGFLGYPLLQTADILLYKANYVPVGEDQVPHIEMSREIARRFNHVYGMDAHFKESVAAALKKLGKKDAKQLQKLILQFQEQGDSESLDLAEQLLAGQQNLSNSDREYLSGHVKGTGKMILQEPTALLTKVTKFPGLDGQKMSKSYNNVIRLTAPKDEVRQQIKTMPTDPARVRRTDPGDPAKCPVWEFHKIYSEESTQKWVQSGCKSASIGCIECKECIIGAILAEQEPILERAASYDANPGLVKDIVAAGTAKAQKVAKETIIEVRDAMNLKI